MTDIPLHLRLAYEACYADPYVSTRQPRRLCPLCNVSRNAPGVQSATTGRWFSSLVAAAAAAGGATSSDEEKRRAATVRKDEERRARNATIPNAHSGSVKAPGPEATLSAGEAEDVIDALAVVSSPPHPAPKLPEEARRQQVQQDEEVFRQPPPPPAPQQEQLHQAAETATNDKVSSAQEKTEVERAASHAQQPQQAPSTETGAKPVSATRQRVEIVYDLPSDHPAMVMKEGDRRGLLKTLDDVTGAGRDQSPEEGEAGLGEKGSVSPWATKPENAAATVTGAATTTTTTQTETGGVARDPKEGQGEVDGAAVPSGDSKAATMLADVVDQLYDKLRVNAVKVVALDDLNQQLIEKFGIGQKPPATVAPTVQPTASAVVTRNEKEELALHLYTLRAQVRDLQKLLDDREHRQQRELAKLVAGSAETAQSRGAHRRLTVEIVKATEEEEPVPYRKPPFRKAQRQSRDEATPTSKEVTRAQSRKKAAHHSKHTDHTIIRRNDKNKKRSSSSSSSSSGRSSSESINDNSFASYSAIEVATDPESLSNRSSSTSLLSERKRGGPAAFRRSHRSTSTDGSEQSSSSSPSTTSSSSRPRREQQKVARKASLGSDNTSSSSTSKASQLQSSDSSDSSTGELFWKRRAAAAAAAARARQEQQGQRQNRRRSSTPSSRTTTSTRKTPTTTSTSTDTTTTTATTATDSS